MTEAEVVGILDEPGDYRNAPDNVYGDQPATVFGRGNPVAHHYLLWQSDTVEVVIGFVNADGETRVTNGLLCSMQTRNEDPLRNMWWRAGQRWRRWFAALAGS
jgi:hypothetical protein